MALLLLFVLLLALGIQNGSLKDSSRSISEEKDFYHHPNVFLKESSNGSNFSSSINLENSCPCSCSPIPKNENRKEEENYEDKSPEELFLILNESLLKLQEIERQEQQVLTQSETSSVSSTPMMNTSTFKPKNTLPKLPVIENESPLGTTLQSYYDRLNRIFELDLKVVENVMSLLVAANETHIPNLVSSLEPIISSFENLGNNINPLDIIQNAGKVLSSSELELKLNLQLKDLNFNNMGPMAIDGDGSLRQNILSDSSFHYLTKMISAQFDNSGLAFPISALILGSEAFNVFSSVQHSHLVSQILTNKIKDFLKRSSAFIEMKNGDIIMSAYTPELFLANRCDITAKLGSSLSNVIVKGSSKLSVGGSGFSSSPSLLLGGEVDLSVALSGSLAARTGKQFFSKCINKYSKKMPVKLQTHGRVWIGAKLITKDPRIEYRALKDKKDQDLDNSEENQLFAFTDKYQTRFKRNSKDEKSLFTKYYKDKDKVPHLVFNLDIDLSAQILHWNINSIWIKNCHIKFLGIQIYSFCDPLKKRIKHLVKELASESISLHLPFLLKRLESILLYKLGDEVSIPLLIFNEKAQLLESLLSKTLAISALKADLAKDLAYYTSSLLPSNS